MHTCNIAVLATYSPLCVHQTLELHLRVHIYLSNYRYRAYRAYPGDPAGRQSGASITASTFLNDGEK